MSERKPFPHGLFIAKYMNEFPNNSYQYQVCVWASRI